MTRSVRLSEPYVHEDQPGRYGRDFHDAIIGSGRIEETGPKDMPSNSNAVGRVVVRFDETSSLPTIDARDVHGVPVGYWVFRRQIIHEDMMTGVVERCIDEALTLAGRKPPGNQANTGN